MANVSEELRDFMMITRQAKEMCERLHARTSAVPITVEPLKHLTTNLAFAKTKLEVIRRTPGIGAYATSVTGATDLAADYTAIVSGLDTVIDEVKTLVGAIELNGYAATEKMNANGTWENRQFASSAPAIVSLRSVLSTFTAGLPAWINRHA